MGGHPRLTPLSLPVNNMQTIEEERQRTNEAEKRHCCFLRKKCRALRKEMVLRRPFDVTEIPRPPAICYTSREGKAVPIAIVRHTM